MGTNLIILIIERYKQTDSLGQAVELIYKPTKLKFKTIARKSKRRTKEIKLFL